MAVLSKALPKRILLVDDDELELELMADRLKSIGFEVATAANGREALALLERRWFPVVMTDREMPVMGGLELTERLRGRGVDDTYVIMLTVRDSGLDYERGYLAGVDDYLTKKLSDAELLARVQKGFSTSTMRRSLQAQSQCANDGRIDASSGAYASDYLMASMLTECRRAERYQRNLAILTVGVAIDPTVGGARAAPDEALAPIVDTIRSNIRSHVDWIARASSRDDTAVFVAALPEASTADAVGIKCRIQSALRVLAETAGSPIPAPGVVLVRVRGARPGCAETSAGGARRIRGRCGTVPQLPAITRPAAVGRRAGERRCSGGDLLPAGLCRRGALSLHGRAPAAARLAQRTLSVEPIATVLK
jgi:PleD family two-component response regulator